MTLWTVLFLGLWWFAAGYLVAYLWDRYVRRQQLTAKRLRRSLQRYLRMRHAALNPPPTFTITHVLINGQWMALDTPISTSETPSTVPAVFRTVEQIQAEQDRQSVERLLASLSTYDPNSDGA